MHQEHAVPWNGLASNFKFVRECPAYYRSERLPAFFPRQLATQTNSLQHFARLLRQTITTFSVTERAKYETSFPAPVSVKIFSDDLRERHPEYLNKRNQLLENWIKDAKYDVYNQAEAQYTTRHGGLANVVKVLMYENQMETLFMLAHHPQIPLASLQNLSWGHHFGFSRVMESALHAYVFFNMCFAMGILEGGEYLEMPQYRSMVETSTFSMDYPAQQIPHQKYLDALPKDSKTNLPIVHRDLEGLKDYLKELFRLLYRFDMLLKECGRDPQWENEVVTSIYQITVALRIEYSECDGGNFVCRFA